MQAELKSQVVQSLINLLEAQSSRPKPQNCRQCGQAAESIDADCWLYGTELKWQISLPLCPACDAETEEIPN